MRTFARKPKTSQKAAFTKSTLSSLTLLEQRCEAHSMRHLQRTIGNQAVQRLFPAAHEVFNTVSTTTAPTRFSHNVSQVPSHLTTHTAVQPELEVNIPGDPSEREAGHVADQVMHMSEPQLQRTSPSEGGASKGQAEYSDRKHLQTEEGREPEIDETEAPPIIQKVINSSGQSLDSGVRAFMEPRFGHDFSHVRVHQDTTAALSAQAVNAVAYTVGKDIVFGEGAYSPASSTGKRLLAHELAHVIQQSQGRTDFPQSVNGSFPTMSTRPERTVQREPAPARAFAALTLSAIKCIFPDDQFGDEVYITVNGQRVWGPVSMDIFDIAPINRQIEFSSGPLVVRVFDQESWPLRDNLIGAVSIPLPGSEEEIRRAPTSAILATNGAYELYFQVHRV